MVETLGDPCAGIARRMRAGKDRKKWSHWAIPGALGAALVLLTGNDLTQEGNHLTLLVPETFGTSGHSPEVPVFCISELTRFLIKHNEENSRFVFLFTD